MARLTTYQTKLRALLSPRERRALEPLTTPGKIQTFLDRFPANVLGEREHTMRSPREALKARKLHCMEGAMLGALALSYQGAPPLLMDFAAAEDDFDHVVALFKEDSRWGAISKTNYPINRWRDPVYLTPRELAMSYFHEYFLEKNGTKTLLSYSGPFDLRRFDPARWVTLRENVDWLADELSDARHYPIAPRKAMQHLRPASKVEIRAIGMREWTKDGRKRV